MKKLLPLLCLVLLLLPAAALGDILINEIMALNGEYTSGENYDWIEIVNNGSKAVDLSGWHLSDSKKDPEKFTFPKGTKIKANSYIVIWCTGEDGVEPGKSSPYSASFALSSSGETIRLTDADGNEVQTLKYPAQWGNVSWGRASGTMDYGYLASATRGKKNDSAVYQTRCDAPVLTTKDGFYSGSVTITCEVPEGCTVRYTTDGETPTASSKAFPANGMTVKKTTVVRVRAFRGDAVPSETVSATYFVDVDQKTPIVSLISDDAYLFNKKTGALVKGTGSVPNYSKGYEYPINIEYFNGEGACEINQMGTFTVSGHSARINAQKSIALHARKAWGPETFAFNPFPTRDYTEYKALLLRAANSDTYATRLRDVVASSLAEGQGIYYQDYVVIQVYINGKYWGHYNLRERINKYSLAQYEGVTDQDEIDAIDILNRTGRDEFVINGDNTDWLELCDFCKTHDLNDPENLAWVEERLDIDNMFTHAAFEIILGNVDFTNVRVYRVPGGKWKYILFDVEACWRGEDATPIEYYIKPVSARVNGFRHEPLNALLAVPEYKDRFLKRVAEILEQSFQWPYVEERFDRVTSILEEILPDHIARWKNITLKNWRTNVNAVKFYARTRPKKIPSMLKKAMKLTDEEVEYYFGDVLRLLEVTNTK